MFTEERGRVVLLVLGPCGEVGAGLVGGGLSWDGERVCEGGAALGSERARQKGV